MSVVTSGLRRTMTRERELRLACEALLSAADGAQVGRVVHTAVAALLAPGTPHRAVLLVPADDASGPDPGHGPEDTGEPDTQGGAVSMRYTRTLPAAVASQLTGVRTHAALPALGRRQPGG